MAESDNTSYGFQRASTGRQTPTRGRLRVSRKHIQYLQDVSVAALLAVLVWVVFVMAGVLQP